MRRTGPNLLLGSRSAKGHKVDAGWQAASDLRFVRHVSGFNRRHIDRVDDDISGYMNAKTAFVAATMAEALGPGEQVLLDKPLPPETSRS
jgi:hypothetical protein